MERTQFQSWLNDDSDIVPASTDLPSVQELERLCPVKDTWGYFEKIASNCPRLKWNSELEIIVNGKLHKGTNIIKLVSAIYSPPPHRIKGDLEFAFELCLKKIFPPEIMEKAGRIGSSYGDLLHPYPNWADTTAWYNHHWRYFTNDDNSLVESSEPYLTGLNPDWFDVDSDSELGRMLS
jgi:hypothetical protein